MKAKYIDKEAKKDLLVDFLNQRLPEKHQIKYLQEFEAYEKSLMAYRDMFNVMQTQREEGIEIGIELGVEKVIITSFQEGLPLATIAVITRKTIEEVKAVLKEAKLLP